MISSLTGTLLSAKQPAYQVQEIGHAIGFPEMPVNSVPRHVSTAGVLGNIACSYDARTGIDRSYQVEEVPAPGTVRKRIDHHNSYFFDVLTKETDRFPRVAGAQNAVSIPVEHVPGKIFNQKIFLYYENQFRSPPQTHEFVNPRSYVR
jgi:hypothetical protein